MENRVEILKNEISDQLLEKLKNIKQELQALVEEANLEDVELDISVDHHDVTTLADLYNIRYAKYVSYVTMSVYKREEI